MIREGCNYDEIMDDEIVNCNHDEIMDDEGPPYTTAPPCNAWGNVPRR